MLRNFPLLVSLPFLHDQIDFIPFFHHVGKEDYADLTGVKDADLDKSEEVKNDYGKYKVTFKYW